MTYRLYNIWLQDAASQTAQDAIQAQIQQAGLLEQGGQSVGRIAVDEIDLTITGQFRMGDVLSRKHAVELNSLAASNYAGVPLFKLNANDPKAGYYEIAGADVQQAHPTTEATYQYTIAFSHTGGHETHWRAVRTNVENGGTSLASGGDDLIGIDAAATKARWFVPSNGTEIASAVDTVEGEFGSVERYHPGDSTFDGPTLIYEVDFAREPETDVLVYDDRNADKQVSFTTAGGEQYDTFQYDSTGLAGHVEATRWPHVFNITHEYDGRPVVDTGRLRVTFDEGAGEITADQWDTGTSSWQSVSIDHTDYDLFDADVVEIGPSDVRVFTEWKKTNGAIDRMVLSFQRGYENVVVRIPENESAIDSDLLELIRPIASSRSHDAQPTQDLIRREEVR